MSARPEHAGSTDIGDTFDPNPLDDLTGRSTGLSCATETLGCTAGEIIVLRVAGEIDLCTQPTLRLALEDNLGRRPAHLVIDLSRTTFCSLRGLLAPTRHSAAKKATGYAVTGVPPHLDRIWTLGWER